MPSTFVYEDYEVSPLSTIIKDEVQSPRHSCLGQLPEGLRLECARRRVSQHPAGYSLVHLGRLNSQALVLVYYRSMALPSS